MSTDVVNKFKWFWVWQDEAEERWLGQMSKEGYHLISVSFPCIYTFRKDEPHDYTYRLDYRLMRKNDEQEYLQLFEDSGWKYLGNMYAWQYFRKENKVDEIDEIYTDNQSKRAKYRRVLYCLGFFHILLLAILLERILDIPLYPWWGNVHVIIILVLLALTYAIIKTALRMKKLKNL